MAKNLNKLPSPKNKNAPNTQVAEFMSEIKKASGLTHHEIAEQLDPSGAYSLSAVAISQYLTGKKTMSEHRMLVFARQAKTLGWHIPSAETMLAWDEIYPQEWLDESSSELKKTTKSSKRSMEAAIAALAKSFETLTAIGLEDRNIVGLAIMMTQKAMLGKDVTHGGLVNLAWLRETVGLDTTCRYDMKWLTWQFMNLDSATEYISAINTPIVNAAVQPEASKTPAAKTTKDAKSSPKK